MKSLVLLHGAIGSQSQLMPLKALLQNEFDLHLMNFPGHGGTATETGFSIRAFAHALRVYIEQQGLIAPAVFGYSMGGYVASYLAAQQPGYISSIITLATKFNWTEEIAAKEIRMLQPEVIRTKLPEFAKVLAQRHAPEDWTLVLSRTAEMLLEMGRENPLSTDHFRNISIPVQVMLGDRDKMVTMEETENIYRELPNGSLAILPRTGHPIETVDAELLAYMICRFVK